MTTNIEGRDLDVACARAMGTYRGTCFGTDPGTLDEKLAWLRKRGFIVLSIGDDNETSARFMQRNADVEDILVVGKDVHEATARLVVEVKEAMGDA